MRTRGMIGWVFRVIVVKRWFQGEYIACKNPDHAIVRVNGKNHFERFH
jgi:hypothetical protein